MLRSAWLCRSSTNLLRRFGQLDDKRFFRAVSLVFLAFHFLPRGPALNGSQRDTYESADKWQDVKSSTDSAMLLMLLLVVRWLRAPRIVSKVHSQMVYSHLCSYIVVDMPLQEAKGFWYRQQFPPLSNKVHPALRPPTGREPWWL